MEKASRQGIVDSPGRGAGRGATSFSYSLWLSRHSISSPILSGVVRVVSTEKEDWEFEVEEGSKWPPRILKSKTEARLGDSVEGLAEMVVADGEWKPVAACLVCEDEAVAMESSPVIGDMSLGEAIGVGS